VPFPNGVPMGDTVGDVLNLDMTGATGPVVVATVSGTVVSGSTQPLSFQEIEDINLNDGGPTNVVMGDLYARGTSGPDIFQVSLNASPQPGQPVSVRLRANSTFYTVTMTTKAIIYGRDGNDQISMVNVALPAEFYGEGNDDVLTGFSGNDLLVGGLGLDRVNGGAGNNTLYGDNSTGNGSVFDGNDIVTGGAGNDILYGGGGNDTMTGAGGVDYLYGNSGDDNMDGGDGNDRLYGGGGNDTMSGATGDDLLAGNTGNDKLYGKSGNDVVIGGDGADLVMGEDGNDLLFNGTITYNSPAPPVVGTDNSTTANDTNDQAMLALLNAWAAGSLNLANVTRVHDAFVDTLGGGTGTDTAHAKPTDPFKDLGDWEILLP
jgi:fibronectin-binding autotransporter adhesin